MAEAKHPASRTPRASRELNTPDEKPLIITQMLYKILMQSVGLSTRRWKIVCESALYLYCEGAAARGVEAVAKVFSRRAAEAPGQWVSGAGWQLDLFLGCWCSNGNSTCACAHVDFQKFSQTQVLETQASPSTAATKAERGATVQGPAPPRRRSAHARASAACALRRRNEGLPRSGPIHGAAAHWLCEAASIGVHESGAATASRDKRQMSLARTSGERKQPRAKPRRPKGRPLNGLR